MRGRRRGEKRVGREERRVKRKESKIDREIRIEERWGDYNRGEKGD